MINFWQQFFFRDIIEHHVLSEKNMPVIDDNDSLLEDAEPLEQYEDDEDDIGDDGELPDIEEDCEDVSVSLEDPDIKAAVRIVRAENAAYASLLQREMGIGYDKAERLLEYLEELDVVGPFDGSQPREVLPYDEPDDGSEGEQL